jgi:hypothetical protein
MPMLNALHAKLPSWKHIRTPSVVLHWIRQGVPLIFKEPGGPSTCHHNNPHFSIQERFFIRKELKDLVQRSMIQKVNYVPHCVSPIKCVPKKNKKLRLITDLRFVNNSIDAPKFQLDGINSLAEYVEHNDQFISLDLKDGFFHVPVDENYWKYLGFCFENQYYVWCVLPFGLCCSPYYFYKVLRPVINYLREHNVRCLIYVDDCLVAAHPHSILEQRELVIKTFQDLGFTINFEKSCTTPSNRVTYIGYIIDSIGRDNTPWLYMTQAKIRKLKKDITRCLESNRIRARQLAKIAGQAIAMSRAILPGKLKLRSIYSLLGAKSSWSDILSINSECARDLRWWLNNIDGWNGSPLRLPSIDCQIWTDASGSGWGCVLKDQYASGKWDRWAYSKHINYKELLTVLLAVKSFGEQIKGRHLQVLTDSITAAAYINNMGGPVQELSDLAEIIWGQVLAKDLVISCKHISGCINTEADRLSRLSPQYEWTLNPNLFQVIDHMWGPHTIDRFASYSTSQLTRYNSRFLDPATCGVDALAQSDWGIENNFVNPPFRMLDKVMDIIMKQRAWATVIAPKWTGQIWYQKLRRMLVGVPFRIHMNSQTMLQMGTIAEPIKNSKWKIFAWRLYGGKSFQV